VAYPEGMSLFERVLVPVDGSVASEAAVALAVRIAKESAAALTFCTVVDCEKIIGQFLAVPYGDAGPSLAYARQEGERVLSAALAAAAAAGLSAQTRMVEGSPLDEIVRFSRDERIDLIVMGSHGRRGLARMFMGSVAEGVLRASSVPVLVVRGHSAAA
jgi:nucleotide-binding universal stress UspA family protein